MTRLLVSAGEPSGERIAAEVVRELHVPGQDVTVEAVGGDALAAAGASLVARSERMEVMGFAEAVASIPHHLALLRRIDASLRAGRYDAVVLVDYPGFHLRVAARAARVGVPVLYYVAPQTWAWGEWRLRALRTRVRQLAVTLPFEADYFRAHGVATTFVGHPILDRPPAPSRQEARALLSLPTDVPVLALFPGSRARECVRHWPVFRDAADRVRALRPETVVVLACERRPDRLPDGFLHWRRGAAVPLAAADAGIVKSGTVTLEAALADMPMVIAYRLDALGWQIARRAVHVPWVSLVNLVVRRYVVPEMLQGAATPAEMARAVMPLFDPADEARRRQRAAFADVRRALGPPGAGRRVAALALDLAA